MSDPSRPPTVFVLVGPSGVGKGSVAAAIVERVPKLWLSRSWTTRPRRASDAPDAYRFVDRATFESRADAGGFIEWAEVFGNLYGTPVPEAPPGHDVLLEIDVQGAEQVRARTPDAVVILLLAPSRAAQEERLRGRGDDDATVSRRLAEAEREEVKGRELADHVVVNDDLTRATGEVAAIVEAHRTQAG
ncbi:MAG TPA: guanylate kinase [Acidimicrobiales bacterium]|nr:guanylate kinase [Acidimicrobiales bacterium]